MQSVCCVLRYHVFRILFYHIPHYLTIATFFRKEVIEHKVSFFILSTNSLGNVSLSKNNLALFNHDYTCVFINRLTPNDAYMGRTALLTSKSCNLYIYSTNIGTEYFKHALYSPFFSSSKCSLCHNANLFGSCIIHILYTGCAKIKKIIPAPKD